MFLLLIPLVVFCRYLSSEGIDHGSCSDQANPCKTFGYVLNLMKQSKKHEEIEVLTDLKIEETVVFKNRHPEFGLRIFSDGVNKQLSISGSLKLTAVGKIEFDKFDIKHQKSGVNTIPLNLLIEIKGDGLIQNSRISSIGNTCLKIKNIYGNYFSDISFKNYTQFLFAENVNGTKFENCYNCHFKDIDFKHTTFTGDTKISAEGKVDFFDTSFGTTFLKKGESIITFKAGYFNFINSKFFNITTKSSSPLFKVMGNKDKSADLTFNGCKLSDLEKVKRLITCPHGVIKTYDNTTFEPYVNDVVCGNCTINEGICWDFFKEHQPPTLNWLVWLIPFVIITSLLILVIAFEIIFECCIKKKRNGKIPSEEGYHAINAM